MITVLTSFGGTKELQKNTIRRSLFTNSIIRDMDLHPTRTLINPHRIFRCLFVNYYHWWEKLIPFSWVFSSCTTNKKLITVSTIMKCSLYYFLLSDQSQKLLPPSTTALKTVPESLLISVVRKSCWNSVLKSEGKRERSVTQEAK